MRATQLLLLVLFACGAPTPPTDETPETDETDTDLPEDTSTVDTSRWGDRETDTDTDTGRNDTDLLDTDRDTDDTDDSDTDDTDAPSCRFGEVVDCDNNCFPQYLIGDGYCDDDQDPLPANFNCVRYASDGGDCAGGTGTGDPCGYLLRFWSGNAGLEMSWELQNAAGAVVASERLGFYGGNNRFYDRYVVLPAGGYKLIGRDDFGDGWNGGYWMLVDPITKHVIAEGRDFTGFAVQKVWNFTTTCTSAPGCQLDATVRTNVDADEISWELYASSQLLVTDVAPNSFVDNAERTDTIDIYPGRYDLRLRDAGRNGWAGGRLELRYPTGRVYTATSLTGTSALFTFQGDCSLATLPPLQGDGFVVSPSSCTGIRLDVQPRTAPREMAFTFRQVSTWGVLVDRAVGAFANGQPATIPFNAVEGEVYLNLVDDGGNGWQGGQVIVRDPGTDRPLGRFELDAGASGGLFFTIDCPEPQVDTDDTDDTDVVVGACLPGAVQDCNGVCFPQAWLGDRQCDDGTQWSADFACPTFNNDRGDCAAP